VAPPDLNFWEPVQSEFGTHSPHDLLYMAEALLTEA